MRRLAIAAVLLTSCTLATAQEISTPPQNGNLFTRLWSSDPPPPAKKASTTEKKAEPLSAEKLFAREEQALNRRDEVILKLREIALRTGDDALALKADELQDRAWKLYQQKTASGGGK